MSIRRNGANLNVANGVREFALSSPKAVAVVDGDRSLSYEALDARSNRVANALLARGLRTGDRVAFMSGNRLEYPEIVCGIAKAGLVTVPVNPRLTASEVAYIVGHSGARFAVAEQDLLEPMQAGVEEHGLPPATLLDGDYDALIEGASGNDPRIDVDECDPFTVCYTAGTTGQPKGVLISHRSRSLTFYGTALEWNLGLGRTTLAVAPMYHGAGFAFAYAACHTGGAVVMMRRWDPEHLLDLVERHRPNSIFLVPAHVQMLRALGDGIFDRRDLSSLRTIYTNAAPMPQELKVWLLDRLPSIELHEIYGSTEAGVVTCLRPPDQLRKVACVGTPWLLNDVRVCRPDGTIVDPGEPGELWSRSPYVFSGYLDDDAATKEASTEDGFVSAGDIAVRDDEGYIYIVDRIRDMILSGGVNVYPREVEEVLYAHPGVQEVAVVGAPDETWGERVVAVVVPRGDRPEESVLIEFCRERLAGFKVPKQVIFNDALPRNAAGKILKREIRGKLRDEQPTQ